MPMTKQAVVKDDGRMLTYYWFAKQPKAVAAEKDCACSSSESASPQNCDQHTESHD